jgi:hypothetical protein
LTVQGKSGSYAQTYAKDREIPFTADGVNGGTTIVLYVRTGVMTVNGAKIPLDVPPQIINDRTMLPLRAIFEALAADVSWDAKTQTVTARKDGTTVVMQIGSDIMTVNGAKIPLDVPPQIIGVRTLIPVRAAGEALSARVSWDDAAQTVTIEG